VKFTRLRSTFTALLLAGLSTLLAIATVLADGGSPPYPH
jgi:hypothetical protein